MFRIQKTGNGQVVFTLSGRIEADDLAEIRQQLAQETGMDRVVLDLKDVTLVNEAAVEFLVRCEATNISLHRCPGYIRQWMEQSKAATMAVKR
jgi:ABC-type transporter Mla MlaB component